MHIYFQATFRGKVNYMYIYQYLLPSVYLAVLIFVLYFVDNRDQKVVRSLTFSAVVNNPMRLFDVFAILLFPAYLIHSAVLRQVHSAVLSGYDIYIEPIHMYLRAKGFDVHQGLLTHVYSTCLSFLMVIIISLYLVIFIRKINVNDVVANIVGLKKY